MCDKLLPEESRIEGVDDILYDIGLSSMSNRDEPRRRNWIHKPMTMFILNSIFILNTVINISIKTDQHTWAIYLGDLPYMMGMKLILNAMVFIAQSIVISMLMINYFNYKRNICHTFIRVFKMISGSVTPEDIGLYNINAVHSLCKVTRFLMKIARFNSKSIIPVMFVFTLFMYYNQTTINKMIIFGLPCAILYSICSYYDFNNYQYHSVYFYILCRYLKLKINYFNQTLIKTRRKNKFFKIQEMCKSYNALCREVGEYNATYWSKFILVIWLSMSTTTALLLTSLIFSTNIFSFITQFYILCVMCSVFLFVIFTAASVNSCANKSYKYINSLYICFIRKKKPPKNISPILKV